MRLTALGLPAVVLATVLGCKNYNKDNILQPEIPRASVNGSELKYISPKDKLSTIQIQEGDVIVMQTEKSYCVLPAFLGGTLEVKVEPEGALKHFNPDDKHEGYEVEKGYRPTFFMGSVGNRNDSPEFENNFIPSTIFLAQFPIKAKVTITFLDKKGNKQEETTYDIDVQSKK